MSQPNTRNYTNCTIDIKLHQQLQTTPQYTTFTNTPNYTRLQQCTPNYKNYTLLQNYILQTTPFYCILRQITSTTLNLANFPITPKFSNYANYNKPHQLHQTTPTHQTTSTTPTHLTTATTVTKPSNLKLQQCTPTAPNYTTLYELHRTRKEPQQTTPITRTTSATLVYINYTYYTVE